MQASLKNFLTRCVVGIFLKILAKHRARSVSWYGVFVSEEGENHVFRCVYRREGQKRDDFSPHLQ